MSDVVDRTDEQRLVLTEDGHEAELVYDTVGDRLVLVHTGVPDALGGRGLGGVLVRAAIAKAQAAGSTLVPQCQFARGWLEKHPDEASAVTIDWPSAG